MKWQPKKQESHIVSSGAASSACVFTATLQKKRKEAVNRGAQITHKD